MKTIILLLFSATLGVAQTPDPFKGANTIIYTLAKPDAEAFEELCKALVNQGYALEIINKDYQQVRTGFRTLAFKVNYRLVVNINAGEVKIRPQLQEAREVYDWEYLHSRMWYNRDVYDKVLGHFSAFGRPMYAKN